MRFPAVRLGLVLLGGAILAGCSEDESKLVTPAPALSVTVTANPAAPRTGAPVAMQAVVSPASAEYTYQWTATHGALSSTTEAAVTWTAPDADSTYTIQVVVNDGGNAAVGQISLVVSDYVPAVDPHYVGAATCAGCHGATYATWSQSAHAGALQTLSAIGMGSNSSCLGCHTVGYDTAVADGGYDEQQVERLAGVQCETCHTAGSGHAATHAGGLPSDASTALCGDCHDGPHHPTLTEWSVSGHATMFRAGSELTSVAQEGDPCSKCHNGLWAADYLDDPTRSFASVPAPTDTLSIGCSTCHDPHGNGNPAQLRDAVNDIALPDGTHPAAGAGRLCIACHNGRRSPGSINGQVNNGTSHFGPHHSNQGDMLAGTGAYTDSLPTEPGFVFTSSRHIAIADGCVSCHTHRHGDEANTFTGHNFQPTVEACQPCHGQIQDFNEIRAKQDYDNDGSIDGVQSEVEGLTEMLARAIIETSATPAQRDSLQQHYDSGDFAAAVGNTELTTKLQRQAGYNYFFVANDQSKGVHNATYSIQLLQQSILALGSKRLEGAPILKQ
jgi:hypothetical protein